LGRLVRASKTLLPTSPCVHRRARLETCHLRGSELIQIATVSEQENCAV
jgi:hypothetical protein